MEIFWIGINVSLIIIGFIIPILILWYIGDQLIDYVYRKKRNK